MNWKTVRLELAQTADFPRGSAGRAFLIRVPLDRDGRIDGAAVERNPSHATVRRFWASEPDEFGQVIPLEGGWALRCNHGKSGGSVFRLNGRALELNREVELESADGARLPFRVASIRKVGSFAVSRA